MGKFDFSGWATRNNIRCADGRTIRKNAFVDDDGKTVPLVWQHKHDDPANVLGHALLENRDDGVYTYCTFNESPQAKTARELVQHGDITSLSIYANHLRHDHGDVMHGCIREVSLVLAGANPGAYIDVLSHSDDDDESEGIIYTDGAFLMHADDNDEDEGDDEDMSNYDPTLEDIYQNMSPEKKDCVNYLVGAALSGVSEIAHAAGDDPAEVFNDMTDEEQQATLYLVGKALEENQMQHADDDEDDEDLTVGDVFNNMTDEQKAVVYFMVGKAVDDATKNKGESDMKHNLFENDATDYLSHADIEDIFADAKRVGSLREACLQHGVEDLAHDDVPKYGITNIGELYPEYHNLNTPPEFVTRDMNWVSVVMNGVHKTPFARIKSMWANLTEDEARAKGYIKGKIKKEQFFSVMKRTTAPTTIYKKQKMDRDDILDVTDFDVVAWLKQEMKFMLDEEQARAILVGDGRNPSSDDKIPETNIRPIWKDDDVFTIKVNVPKNAAGTVDENTKQIIRAAVKSRKDYKGSGNLTFFTTEDTLTDMLLMEDKMGHVIYDTMDKLSTAMRVSKIVTAPILENQSYVDDEGKTHTLIGLMVNLTDYNVGTDRKGEPTMFEDFDIDYNAQKYLIETRKSGAMVKPYAAIALEYVTEGT